MARQGFSKPVMRAIIIRASKGEPPETHCEMCGIKTTRFQIDHIIADGLRRDKSVRLTAKDGQLLCSGRLGSCHDVKTAAVDVPAIAKAKRVEDDHTRLPKTKTALAGRSPEVIRAANAPRKPPLPPRSLYGDVR